MRTSIDGPPAAISGQTDHSACRKFTNHRRHSRRLCRRWPALVEQLEDRRLMAAGDLSASFGTGGIVHSDWLARPLQGSFQDLLELPDGRIVGVSPA